MKWKLDHRTLGGAAITALVTLLAITIAEEARCEDAPKVDVFKPLAIYGLGRGLDYASTRYVIGHARYGAREAWGPTIALGGPAPAAVISTALLVGTDVLLQKGGHHGLAKALRIGATAAALAAVGNNYVQLRKVGRR